MKENLLSDRCEFRKSLTIDPRKTRLAKESDLKFMRIDLTSPLPKAQQIRDQIH